MFYASLTEIKSNQISPCDDCVFMHALLAKYNLSIWRRCLHVQTFIPSAIGIGWSFDEENDFYCFDAQFHCPECCPSVFVLKICEFLQTRSMQLDQ